MNIWEIRKKRKKEAQEKGGENSPISPPLDPRLSCYQFFLEQFRWVACSCKFIQ